MPGNPKLVVDIITNASKAGTGIDQATSKFGKFNSTMGRLVGPATAVLAGITAIGVGAVNAASDLQQAAGGVDAVFGDSAQQIHDWAAEAADAVGLSASAYSGFAAQIGAQLKNLGVPMDQVAGKTDDLISLGADLAATYGGTTEDAVSALGAAFRGEADPAERYGLALNQTAVNAELAARGMDGLKGDALASAKAQIIMEKATEQAGGAIGQFGRESDTVAGQQQRLSANVEDMSAALGESLLPILSPIVAALAEFAKWIQQNAAWITPVIGLIGALAAAVIVYTAAQWAMNFALTANPIGLLITGIVLLIAALVAAGIWIASHTKEIGEFFSDLWSGIMDIVGVVVNWFKSAWSAVSKFFLSVWNTAVNLVIGYFMIYVNIVKAIIAIVRSIVGTVAKFFSDAWKNAVKFVSDVIKNLQKVFMSVFNAIMSPIRKVIGFFNDIVSAIQNVISWLGRIKIPDVFGAIGNLLGGTQSASVSMVASSPPIVGGRALAAVSPRATGVASGGGTVINVNGGLDSADTIARRVRQLLESRDRREGGVRIARATR